MAMAIGARSVTAQDVKTKSPSLKRAAGDRLIVGTAIGSGHLDDPRLAEVVRTHFNCMTPENEVKPDQMQRERGTFTFALADKIVAFAKGNELKPSQNRMPGERPARIRTARRSDGNSKTSRLR